MRFSIHTGGLSAKKAATKLIIGPRYGTRHGGFKFERKHHLTTLERMVRWQEIAYD